ncbi:Asp/Glu/hydantoin racemase [Rhizobium sp. BK313]|uniref:aspartate/glutamate racemase family protein n=1 Tax=Rhizobium sp. BK313 TaxID=2587081 RepID=UPI00105F4E02|nr:aspartate/glutamate racemase family protein [Rhizobium sp. BK313]MBB3458282.1 Asp/Glu/hydantoin racemase [Rhizobium sp. BK313]
MPSLALIHTVSSLVQVFQPLVSTALPGWGSFNILDESLLRNTIRDGALSQTTVKRLAQYVFSATEAGADAIVVTCSSLGDAVDIIRPLALVPLFRIDQGMANAAVASAQRIGILATLPTTLVPTRTMIRSAAAAAGRNCEIVEMLCNGAFERLAQGDRHGHDELVIAGFKALASRSEMIVLAQASMANALEALGPGSPDVPVLTSPQLGMTYVGQELLANAADS